MAWYDPNDTAILTDEQKAAAEAAEQATADAQFRTDLIAVLREIRDALKPPEPDTTPPPT